MALLADLPAPAAMRAWFAQRLAEAAGALAGSRARCHLGGITPAPAPAQDPRARALGWARLDIGLAGARPSVASRGGVRDAFVLGAGEVCYWAPDAWAREGEREACAYLGVVVHRPWLRLILVDHPGGARGLPALVLHTARPLTGPARGVLQALDELAEERAEPGPAAGALVAALLWLARSHLLEDPVRPPRGAAATWERLREHLAEHIDDPGLGRDGVARILGLTPGYLSELCRARAGRSFVQLLQDQRLSRARRLLRGRADLAVAQVAALCGYASPGYFGRAFRRASGLSPGAYRDQPHVGHDGRPS